MNILENVDFVKQDVEFKGETYHYALKFKNFNGERNMVPVSDNVTIKDVVEHVDVFLKNLEFSNSYEVKK